MQDNINEYQIVRKNEYISLSAEVANLLKVGWELRGNLCIATVNGTTYYHQVMVKYDK